MTRRTTIVRRIPSALAAIALSAFACASIFIILTQVTYRDFGNGIFLSQTSIQPTPFILPMGTPLVRPSPTSISESTPLTGFCLSVPVLMYHHIQPMEQAIKNGQTALTVDASVFDSQMNYLSSQGYQTISAEQLVQALQHKALLPQKPIVITIDDGYSDIYSYAFPVAKKYSLILNLMIPTGLMNNSGYLTWDNIREMVGSGRAFVANHTWSHFQLTHGDQVKQQMEIVTAKTQLQQQLGKEDTIFSYPYGSFNDTSIRILQENKFAGAFSTTPGRIQCDSILLALRRDRIGSIPLASYGL